MEFTYKIIFGPFQSIMFLALGAVVCFCLDISGRKASERTTFFILFLSLSSSLISACITGASTYQIESKFLFTDYLAKYCSIALTAIFICIPLIFNETFPKEKFYRVRICGIYLSCCLGMLLFTTSKHFLIMFLALEIYSIGLYVLSGFISKNRHSIEGSIKYFTLSTTSSALFFFGICLLCSNSKSFFAPDLIQILSQQQNHILFKTGSAFFISGLFFKLAIVPFHTWTPDVFESSPTGITAFIAATKKILVVALLIRLTTDSDPIPSWTNSMVVFSAFSILFAGLLSLVQTSLKRMLAYSSITQSGVLVAMISSHSSAALNDSINSILIFLSAHLCAILLIFIILMWLESHTHDNIQLNDLSGLSNTHPFASAMLAVGLISLGGLPPTLGFFSICLSLHSFVASQMIGVLIASSIGYLISLFCYFRIMLLLYSNDKHSTSVPISPARAPITFAVIGALVFFLIFGSTFIEFLLGILHQTTLL